MSDDFQELDDHITDPEASPGCFVAALLTSVAVIAILLYALLYVVFA